MSRNARRRGSWRRFRAEHETLIIKAARALPEHERSAAILHVVGPVLDAAASWCLHRESRRDIHAAHIRTYQLVCDVLRPFVDAGVLDHHEAARAADQAVKHAYAENAVRSRPRSPA